MDIVRVEFFLRTGRLDIKESNEWDRSRYRDDDEFEEAMEESAYAWMSQHIDPEDKKEWGWRLV